MEIQQKVEDDGEKDCVSRIDDEQKLSQPTTNQS